MLEQLHAQVVIHRPPFETALSLIRQLGRHRVTLRQLPPPWRQRDQPNPAITQGQSPIQRARVEKRPLRTTRTEIRLDRPRRLRQKYRKFPRESTWGINRVSPLKGGTPHPQEHLNVQRLEWVAAQIVETTTHRTRCPMTLL